MALVLLVNFVRDRMGASDRLDYNAIQPQPGCATGD